MAIFFHYSFLDSRLIGSESPLLAGMSVETIERFLREHRIGTLISLTERCPALRVARLTHIHQPISGVPTRPQMLDVTRLIGASLRSAEPVWIHCQHGIDRTGCAIGCYLTSIGTPADQVIDALFDRFPPARRQRRMRELWMPYEKLIRSFPGSPNGDLVGA